MGVAPDGGTPAEHRREPPPAALARACAGGATVWVRARVFEHGRVILASRTVWLRELRVSAGCGLGLEDCGLQQLHDGERQRPRWVRAPQRLVTEKLLGFGATAGGLHGEQHPTFHAAHAREEVVAHRALVDACAGAQLDANDLAQSLLEARHARPERELKVDRVLTGRVRALRHRGHTRHEHKPDGQEPERRPPRSHHC